MTALDILLRHGPMPALDVARALGVSVEQVYAFLVRAEAAERVRVNVSHCERGRYCRTWEAMVPDDELPPALRGGALEVF